MEPLGIPGTWVFVPRVYSDDRGSFLELFRSAEFSARSGGHEHGEPLVQP